MVVIHNQKTIARFVDSLFCKFTGFNIVTMILDDTTHTNIIFIEFFHGRDLSNYNKYYG